MKSSLETGTSLPGIAPVMDGENQRGRDPRPTVGGDQEVLIRNQILLAMRMALALHDQITVRADADAFEHGLHGVAEGAAVEIIHTLCMEPSYINLKRL